MAPTPAPPKRSGGFNLKNLSTNQKAALAVGGAVLAYVGYRWYQNRASSASATPATASTDTTGSTGDGGGGVVGGGGSGGGGGGLGNQILSALGKLSDQLNNGTTTSTTTSTPTDTAASTGTQPVVTPDVSQPMAGATTVNVKNAGGGSGPATVGTTTGGTTAQPTSDVGERVPSVNEPTVTTGGGVQYSGISNQSTAQALINRGFTLYKNVNGSFVDANSAAGKASSNKGLYYNPNQSGVK